jgi:SAM-dependent methyltransferase
MHQRLSFGRFALLPDRLYLEEEIFSAISSLRPRRMLDVGVRDYTRHLGSLLPSECERWTIDLDPVVAPFGSPEKHIVGSVLHIGKYFDPGSFDVILLNGLFGFGVDRRDEQETVLRHVRALLREEGRLIIGWDRWPDGRPYVDRECSLSEPLFVDPLETDEVRLSFKHAAPGGLPARKTLNHSWHVFDWFVAG